MSIAQFTPYIGGNRRAAGLGLALVAAAAFGTSGSFADSLMATGWSPGAVVTLRIVVAAVVLTPLAVVQARGRWRRLRASSGMVALYGVLAVAGCQLAFFNAVKHLDVGVALLLEYLGIVLVVLWMWGRHGHRPRRLTLAGMVTALAGLVLVLDPSGGVDGAGVAWGLVAATGLAVFFVVSARSDPELPPLVVAWAGMVVGAVTLAGFGLVGLLPLHAEASDVELFGRELSWIVPVAGLSVVAGGLAYSVGVAATRLLGAKVASFVGLTEVLFAVGFAAVLIGQVPGVGRLLGGVVVLAGVALVQADDAASAGTGASGPAAESPSPAPASSPADRFKRDESALTRR
jgi:drug/metabolite transporter (DMT)-like permease